MVSKRPVAGAVIYDAYDVSCTYVEESYYYWLLFARWLQRSHFDTLHYYLHLGMSLPFIYVFSRS